MAKYWLDENDVDYDTPTMGYLREHTNNNHGGATTYSMSQHPGHTNMSHEPRLYGWLGETNNVSSSALGIARIVRRANNGRVCVETVTDRDTILTYLEETGYPELESELPDEKEPEGHTA